jgi:hypothetical protein
LGYTMNLTIFPYLLIENNYSGLPNYTKSFQSK